MRLCWKITAKRCALGAQTMSDMAREADPARLLPAMPRMWARDQKPKRPWMLGSVVPYETKLVKKLTAVIEHRRQN